jgi:hypothetical protein
LTTTWNLQYDRWHFNFPMSINMCIWAASWQNQHNGFATSMNPDQPAHLRSLMFPISFSTCYRVCKRTAWILIRLLRCAGWFGSMLVANALCWFCHDAAHLFCFNFRPCSWWLTHQSKFKCRPEDWSALCNICYLVSEYHHFEIYPLKMMDGFVQIEG